MANNLFICELCGNVSAARCDKCEGGGKGVTVQEIKDQIEAAPDVTSINATRKHYGRHVASLRKHGSEARTMAIQIDNLVDWRVQPLIWGDA